MARRIPLLLSPNVQLILDRFDLPKPLEARCVINGDLADKGDPAIVVDADVSDNEIRIAGGAITNVSFHAEYNNHSEKGKPNGDPNSVVTVSGSREPTEAFRSGFPAQPSRIS